MKLVEMKLYEKKIIMESRNKLFLVGVISFYNFQGFCYNKNSSQVTLD